MRGRGRGGPKMGERRSFSDRGGSRGGGFSGSGRGMGSGGAGRGGDSRGRGGFRGQDRRGARGSGPRDSGSYRGGSSLKGKQPGGALRKPTWDMSALQPFAKDFYQPHPRVQNRLGVI